MSRVSRGTSNERDTWWLVGHQVFQAWSPGELWGWGRHQADRDARRAASPAPDICIIDVIHAIRYTLHATRYMLHAV